MEERYRRPVNGPGQGHRNFPFTKCDGDLDIALPDGTTDEMYLAALGEALENGLPLAAVDIVFYLAGADPYEHDRFGKLKLTKAGLAERDHLIFELCNRHGLPVTVVTANGYAKTVEDVAEINATTIDTLLSTERRPANERRMVVFRASQAREP